MALLTTTIFPLVSADDYSEKWGDNVGGKGPDNQFIKGRRDKEQNHLSAQFISGREKLDFSRSHKFWYHGNVSYKFAFNSDRKLK